MEEYETIDYSEAFDYKDVIETEKRIIELSKEIPILYQKLEDFKKTYPGIMEDENELEYSKSTIFTWAMGTQLQRRDAILVEMNDKSNELIRLKQIIKKINQDLIQKVDIVDDTEDVELDPMINERTCKDLTKLPLNLVRECWKKGYVSLNDYVSVGLNRHSKNLDWGKSKRPKKSKKPKKKSKNKK